MSKNFKIAILYKVFKTYLKQTFRYGNFVGVGFNTRVSRQNFQAKSLALMLYYRQKLT